MNQELTKEQCRAGRALLGMKQIELAKLSRTGITTIASFETGKGEARPAIRQAIRLALEAAGVEFIDGGVRLKPKD